MLAGHGRRYGTLATSGHEDGSHPERARVMLAFEKARAPAARRVATGSIERRGQPARRGARIACQRRPSQS